MSSVAYLASYLSQAKFLSASFISSMLKRLVDWCLEYCRTHDGDINPNAHRVFYSRCQVDGPTLEGLYFIENNRFFIVTEAEFIPNPFVTGHYVCSLLSYESFYGHSMLEKVTASHAAGTYLKA